MTLQLKAEIFNVDINCNQIMHTKYKGEVNQLRHYHMLILFKVTNRGALNRFRYDNIMVNMMSEDILYQNGNVAFILYKFTSTDLRAFDALIDAIDNYQSTSLKKVDFQHYRLDLKTLHIDPGFLSEMLYEHFTYELPQN
jgi:hypothetical protein